MFPILPDLLKAAEILRAANVTRLDFAKNPTTEPVVICVGAGRIPFFKYPDGNLLEFLTILPDSRDLKL